MSLSEAEIFGESEISYHIEIKIVAASPGDSNSKYKPYKQRDLLNRLAVFDKSLGYGFCLMLGQDEKDENIKIGKIYIKKLNDRTLEYAVLGVDKETVYRNLISVDDFN